MGNSGKASSFADAGARYLVPSNGIADALGCEVFRQLQQGEFERENAAFIQISAEGQEWGPLNMYFPEAIYLMADSAVEQCGDGFKHSDYRCRELSVSITNFAIKVLNTHLLGPLRKLGVNPTDDQIKRVYQNIVVLLPASPGEFQAITRAEVRMRITNVASMLYLNEMKVLAGWMARMHLVRIRDHKQRVTSSDEAMNELLREPVGSLADALGSETCRHMRDLKF